MTDSKGLTLEDFVTKIDLPHRAKVTEGYYEAGDEDGNREFSYGEVIEVRRVLCPLVDLNFVRPGTQDKVNVKVKATVSTRNPLARFLVATRTEAEGQRRSVVFGSVKQLIDAWPNMVETAQDIQSDDPGPPIIVASKGDDLRLIRLIFDDGGTHLELKNHRSMKLVKLPSTYSGSFIEVPDPKSYTLKELVDMARVPRYLKLDPSEAGDRSIPVQGLPSGYNGIIRMDKPLALIEIARVLQDTSDDKDEEHLGAPLLVPIDCDIRLEPRDSSYQLLPFETLNLSSLGDRHAGRIPSLIRIVGWTEESSILHNHVTRPGDQLVVYSMVSVDKVLAHSENQFFLIPVNHGGCFRRTNSTYNERPDLDLKSLGDKSFPFKVRYSNTGKYQNIADDQLPTDRDLTFDRYVKGERSVLVSKIFGDVIGNGFHIPLRTKITIRMEKRWKRSTEPPVVSHLDCCSEEILGTLYNEMMSPTEYEWTPAGKLPPRPPPSRSGASSRQMEPDPRLANRPQPPLPCSLASKKTLKDRFDSSDSSDSDDDAHDYSYIDVREESLSRSPSTRSREENIEIPSNGNISQFSADQMMSFLRGSHVSPKAIAAFKRSGFDGKAFARMADEQLEELEIAIPVIQFFRDRSRMQLVLFHL